MRRDPGLVPLSRQHQHALALCVLTERNFSQEPCEKLAARIVDAYDAELEHHFGVEERILFPALAGHPTLTALVAELIAEHGRLAQLVAELRSQPEAPAIREFTTLLGDHARKEERQLFEQAQQLLPAERMAELGERLREALPDQAY